MIAKEKGKNTKDLEPASKALAYFVQSGCTVQSPVLHGTQFLYTLTCQQGFSYDQDYVATLSHSGSFSITIG
ncbi:unnamed protein product [Adineta ricciae]|uniref:Uncharacterized protein n=1 Tax=Adineta ricciae TaxID=249248 RepID=A0A815J0F1_ADIRI|nr:unnamed protein product [Adineta ricciae]